MHELQVDRNSYLKDGKSETFLIFPIAKPFHQFTSFFVAVGLPNTIQTILLKKRVPTFSNLIACLRGTLDCTQEQ